MLTQADADLLQFEDTHPRHTGLKADLIRSRFDLSVPRYYQRLTALTRTPGAVAVYPQLCKRVQRLSAKRQEQRAGLLRILE